MWRGWMQTIENRLKTLPSISFEYLEPVDLSNKATRLRVKWDANVLKITGPELAAKLDAGTPRILIDAGAGRRPDQMASSVVIMPYMMHPGDDRLIADAIYGALADGDIGSHFPPSDMKWKDANSEIFLKHACDLVEKRGGRIAVRLISGGNKSCGTFLTPYLPGKFRPTPIRKGGAFVVLKESDPRSLEVLRHSGAHILATAVRRLRPDAKIGFGPAIDDGFYYDFEVEKPFTPEDLEAFEAEMHKVCAEAYPFVREEVSQEEAKRRFVDDPLKLERLQDFEGSDEIISTYTDGPFIDLCKGPHVPDTSRLKHFKLLSAAGAYWRGDEKRQMLQRIYATAFFKREELDAHLHQIEQARKRAWFKDTVFVITADHGASARGTEQIPLEKYLIPAFVYSPGNIAPERMDRLMSQIDIAPTLLGILRFSYFSKFMGRDLLHSPALAAASPSTAKSPSRPAATSPWWTTSATIRWKWK